MNVVIDYGMGNLRSVEKAFSRIQVPVCVSSDPRVIAKAGKLVLPGVGHFKNGMDSLCKSGLIELLNEKVLNQKTPILGICLGMQLFAKHSEEGDREGLGWFDARVVKFNFSSSPDKMHVPHIGWNNARPRVHDKIFEGIGSQEQFYFVHSYYIRCANDRDILATTDYGGEFCCALHMDNIYGVQFHPEKSHAPGLALLRNFINV